MCRFLSAIVMQSGDVRWSPCTDSHEHIIANLGLDDRQIEPRRFVRVEFLPGDDVTRIEDYKLKLDGNETPDWWNGKKEKVTKQLQNIVAKMIVNDERDILLGGTWILGPKARIKTVVNSKIIYMIGNAYINRMRGSSRVGVMRNSSRVGVMWGSSSVGEMRGSSSVGKMWSSSSVGVMRDSSSVGVMRDSSRIETDNRNDNKAATV